ncbi:hypothetical protein F5Y15DRAFT_115898 [Xylariaceae sp. FL0016]|nr:hypothetical protein F5Y15DRAFT_115898 [Xylariaceae sp. FL0016]
MAASTDVPSHERPAISDSKSLAAFWKRLTGKSHIPDASTAPDVQEPELSRASSPSSGLIRRVSRKVVPGLPRAKTFKRQQSENREKLEPIRQTQAERRAVSVDRRLHLQRNVSHTSQPLPRASAPDFLDDTQSATGPLTVTSYAMSAPHSPVDEKQHFLSVDDISTAYIEDRGPHDSYEQMPTFPPAISTADIQSTTTSQYDAMIHDELERKWILNLSMHFRDRSKREKFFVTYRETEFQWRRVTISLDYRNAPEDSLEKDLTTIKYQREKSAKIYEAIRESLQDIQFYETVTNLKLQTTGGRLHVHVVEDVNEIVHYPTVRMVQHLGCRRVRERNLEFDSHMSGFVYKVRVGGQTLIKKEIPGPDTVDEFLYEVNALSSLGFSRNIIEFYGVVVDDDDQNVKGLLISFADQGALIDIIYDSQEQPDIELPWSTREKWARQIVQGLSDIHESGFVQGDFTLSNIVIDHHENAKIIDINRRGCPVGWEPPEATPLIDSNQRISMYIGVKSDLYQLGMVLWALATLEDEPEAHRRPLHLAAEIDVPPWYRKMVEICLHENPRVRLQATALLAMFPEPPYDGARERQDLPAISVDDGVSLQEYWVDNGRGRPHIRTVEPHDKWPSAPVSDTYATSPARSNDPYYNDPPRGRSPGSPSPARHGRGGRSFPGDALLWPSTNVVTNQSNEVADITRPETPREAAVATVKKPEDFDKALDLDLEEEQAKVAGGESRSKDAPMEIEAVQKRRMRSVGSAESESLPRNDVPQGPESAGELKGKSKERQDTEAPQASTEKTTALQSQTGTTAPSKNSSTIADNGMRTNIVGKDTAQAGENDTSAYYTFDGGDGATTRATGAVMSGSGTSHVLTGIGGAYENQVEFRQPICSDEDLELHPATKTTTHDVASQA